MAPENTNQQAKENMDSKTAESAVEAQNKTATDAQAPAADAQIAASAAPADAPASEAAAAQPGRTVLVTRPHDGDTLTVESSPGGQVNLGFDPSAATVTRDGNSLVFDIDGQGKVVLQDFFAVGDESLPDLRLPDGTVIATADFFAGSDLDISTAAGPGGQAAAPTAQAPGSGGTSYSDLAGSLIGGVDKIGKLGTDYWSRQTDTEEEITSNIIPNLSLGFGEALTQTDNVNESDLGTGLFLSFDVPPTSTVTLTFTVSGSAVPYMRDGVPEFLTDFRFGEAVGCTFTFDPDTGVLVVTIPANTSVVNLPIIMMDDHANDGAKQIVITLDNVSGNVTYPGGYELTVNVTDDTQSHKHNDANAHETAALDGPLVGLVNRTGDPNAPDSVRYEGDPAGNTFTFGLTLTDPHTGQPYEGYTFLDGHKLMEMTQNMDIFLNPSGQKGGATYGEDYHMVPSEELLALRAEGMVSFKTDAEGRFVLEADGTVKITLNGHVDANGNANGKGVTPFDLSRLDDLTVEVKVLVNGDGTDKTGTGGYEGDEGFSLVISGTSGNESAPAPGAGSVGNGVISRDPVLSLDTSAVDPAGVNEGEASFTVALQFDKEIKGDADVRVVLSLGGDAKFWDGDPNHQYSADYFLPGTKFNPDGTVDMSNVTVGSDGSVTVVTENGLTITSHPDGTVTVVGKGSSFVQSGDKWSVDLEFVLNDDHLAESNENISLSLDKVQIDDGYSGYTSDSQFGDSSSGGVGLGNTQGNVTIVEDTQNVVDTPGGSGVDFKDGPVVGLSGTGGNMVEGDSQDFAITLNDPASGNYMGYPDGQNLLSEDMTITLTVTGSALEPPKSPSDQEVAPYDNPVVYGEDYVLRPTAEFLELLGKYGIDPASVLEGNAADGYYFKVTAGEGGNLTISFTLPGRGGSGLAFDLNDAGKLTFTLEVLNDDITERVNGNINISVGTDGSNESVSAGDQLNYGVGEAPFSGPVISISSEPVTITESKPGADGSFDRYNPEHNEVEHTISLNEPAAEDIQITVTIKPNNPGSKWNTGKAEDDFRFDGKFYDQDGKEVTAEENSDGTYTVTIPKGGSEITFKTDIIDDMREVPSEGGEGYSVSIDLVYKDDYGNVVSKTEGMADGEATLGNQVQSVVISEDLRDGNTNLNPDNFDGPFVSIGVGTDPRGSLTTNPVDKSVTESGDSTVPFVISLLNPNGTGRLFTSTEQITTTLTVKADSPDNGFTLSDMFAPSSTGDISGTIRIYFFDVDNNPVSFTNSDGDVVSYYDCPITGKALDQSVDLQNIPIPAGTAYAKFEVPVHDDPLGVSNKSSNDTPSEAFVVEITKLEGNEARAVADADKESDKDTGSKWAGATITDDSALAPNDKFDEDNTLEGAKVGLSWEGTNIPGTVNEHTNVVEEGRTYNLQLKLYGDDGAVLTSNPYQGYMNGANILPDDLDINMTFTDTPGTDTDLTLKLSDSLANLIASGHVTITCMVGGVELPLNDTYTFDQLKAFAIGQGPVTLTVKSGTNFNDIQSSLSFDVIVHGDNVNEWSKNDNYNETPTNEGFGLKVDSVVGNESSVVEGKHEQNATITDVEDGYLGWLDNTQGSLNSAGTAWSYTGKVGYDGTEGNQLPGAAPALPGEPIHFQLQISDSKSMQHGEEYNVDAFSLFCSLNGLSADATGLALANGTAVTNLATYKAWITELDGNLLAESGERNLVIVDGNDAGWDKYGSITYDVYMPPEKIDQDNGTFSFDIKVGEHAGSGSDGFGVKIVDPYGDPALSYDVKGEIIDVDDRVINSVKPSTIRLGLTGTPEIYEHIPGETQDNVAVYKIGFTDKDGQPIGKVSGNITVDMILTLSDNMSLDENMTNNHLTNMIGDLTLCGKDGTDFTYSSIKGEGESLLKQLNDYLRFEYGPADTSLPANVSVTDIVGSGNSYTFKFFVAEGFDLSNGITINFKALDDAFSDNDEKFTVTLTNVGSSITNSDNPVDNVDNPLDVGIGANRKQSTTVHDETENNSGDLMALRNGFAISVSNGEGWEANNLTDAAGNPAETAGKHIHLPVYAFILDDETSKPMSLESLIALYKGHTGSPLTLAQLVAEGLDAHDGFKDFVNEFFGPKESITVGYTLTPDSADSADYVNKGADTINTNEWVLKLSPDGVLYYEAVNGIEVETIIDHLSEGPESFDLKVNTSGGNESRPLSDDDKQTIKTNETRDGNEPKLDDFNTKDQPSDVIIKDVHDGPNVISFKPGPVVEPINPDLVGKPDPDNATHDSVPNRTATFTITLDESTSEPAIVYLNLKSGDGFATLGEDFVLGDGIYFYNAGTGRVHSFADGVMDAGQSFADFWEANEGTFGASLGEMVKYFTEPKQDSYFTVIPKNESAASFDVGIKHDNDNVDIAGGKDGTATSSTENIQFEISDIQGSEVRWEPGYTSSDGAIEDDGYGPRGYDLKVSFDDDGKMIFEMKVLEAPAEDMYVTIYLETDYGEKYGEINVLFGEGETTGTASLINESGTWPPLVATVTGVAGGEAQGVGDMFALPGSGGHYTHPVITITDIESQNIVEGGDSVEYEMRVNIPANGDNYTLPESADFTLSFRNGDTKDNDFTGGALGGTGDIKITMNKEFLEQYQKEGFADITVKYGSDGKVHVFVNGEQDDHCTVTGKYGGEAKLPSASTDTLLEGNEFFNTVVLSGDGTRGGCLTETIVEDTSSAGILFFDKDGNIFGTQEEYTEGQKGGVEATIKLIAMEGDKYLDEEGTAYTMGQLIELSKTDSMPALKTVTSDKAVDINIKTGNSTTGLDNATADQDYTLESSSVRIPAGEGSATVTIYFPDDYISENQEGFTITGTIDEKSKGVFDELGLIKDSPATNVTINDSAHELDLKWEVNTRTVTEGTSLNIKMETFFDGTRQVVGQDVEVRFILDPKDGFLFYPEDGFCDIDSITVGDKVYSFSPTGDELDIRSILTPMIDGSGRYELVVTMPRNSAAQGVTINTRNDTLSEPDEGFNITLDSVNGGEIGKWNLTGTTGNTAAITVRDDGNGRTMTATPEPSDESTGATINLNFDKGTAPDEDVKVTLQLDDKSKPFYDETGEIILTFGDPAVQYTPTTYPGLFGAYDPDTGTVVVTIPKGWLVDSADVKVTLPVLDNSLAGGQDLTIIVSPSGGETQEPGRPTYNSEFLFEQGPSGATDGGHTRFGLTASKDTGNIKNGDTDITVKGVDPSVVTIIKVGTTKYTRYDPENLDVENTWRVDEGGNIVLSTGDVAGSYTVEVWYKAPENDTEAGLIAGGKVNLDVSAAITGGGTGVTVTVNDDQDDLSGPEVSLVAPTDPVTGAEGEPLALGSLVVELPNLAGDQPGQLIEEITLKLKVSGGLTSITIGGVKYLVPSSGLVDIPINQALFDDPDLYDPKTGKLTLAISGAMEDDAKSNDTDREVSVSIDSWTRGHADAAAGDQWESITVNQTDSLTATVTADDPADYDGPRFSITAAAEQAENAVLFNLSAALVNADFAQAGEDIVLSFTLAGYVPGMVVSLNDTGVTLTDNEDGTCTFTVQISSGTNMADWAGQISVNAGDGKIGETNGDLTLTLDSVSGGEASVSTDSSAVVELIDTDEAAALFAIEELGIDTAALPTLDDMVLAQPGGTYDGSTVTDGQVIIGSGSGTLTGGGADDLIFAGNGTGATIYGGDGNDTIYGGAGNDTIHAGSGHDILNGGGGDDLFVFSGAVDGRTTEINGFEYNTETEAPKDLISFEDIFGDTTSMDTLLEADPSFKDGTYTFTSGNNSLSAKFLDNKNLELSLKSGEGEDGAVQNITIHSETAFYEMAPENASDVQAILENIIKITTD